MPTDQYLDNEAQKSSIDVIFVANCSEGEECQQLLKDLFQYMKKTDSRGLTDMSQNHYYMSCI